MSVIGDSFKPVVAIVQARMTSTRLPGKVMKEICGRPILWHVVHRLKESKRLDRIVVATSVDGSDDTIMEWCNREDIPFYRGSLDDVLDRYYQTAKRFGVKTIVRITADCPLIDPEIVDMAVERFLDGRYDYVSTGGTFPDGLDTEVFSLEALERAWKEADLLSEREHVTPYIWKHPDIFRLSSIKCEEDLSDMRWTVDEERDFVFVTRIFEAFECTERVFHMDEILEILRKDPSLLDINAGIERNEGYARSLREDRRIER